MADVLWAAHSRVAGEARSEHECREEWESV
jgi:hypothetical protein